MDFVKIMKAKAASAPKRLVLPEGSDERIIRTARIIMDEKLASSVTLLGNIADIQEFAKSEGINLDDIEVINTETNSNRKKYAETFYELRKNKGMTPEQAKTDMTDILRYGAMMLYHGHADAMVAGSNKPTGDVLRAGLSIVGTAPGIKTASSCFVMCGLDKQFGKEGAMIFSDCAVVPNPLAEQLADIAECAALSCKEFLNVEPVVALLSFSSKGSAHHADVEKVQITVEILEKRNVKFVFDGELQADAALIPSVLDKKAPGSPVRGKVNVIVFPDLNSGNIGYKLVQRLGNAQAYGPFLQGFAKPISDLSRGASVDDIVTTCAVTLARVK